MTASTPSINRTLAQARTLNARLNAFTHIRDDLAASAAPAPTARTRPSSSGTSSLEGWAVAAKDNFCTLPEDGPTTAASRMLQDYRSPFEATVVSLLKRAGAVIAGKTNMDEFGMGSLNTQSHFGPVTNPAGPVSELSEPRSAGGSSGGSAAAVAAGLSRAALASDTGGSTRLPAALCGTFGLRPSYGMLSRHGVIAYASSLDTVGLIATSASDIHTLWDLLARHDPKDPTAAPAEARHRAHDAFGQHTTSQGDLQGLRLGIPVECFPTELSPSVLPPFRRAVDALRARGAHVQSVSLPTIPQCLSAYYVLANAEASSNLARYDGIRFGWRSPDDLNGEPGARRRPISATRSQGFGDEVQRRILLGTFALTAEALDNYFLQAQVVRKRIREDLAAVLRHPNPLLGETEAPASGVVDALLYPSAIDTAPKLSHVTGEQVSEDEAGIGVRAPGYGYVQDILNVPASLAGLPALSVPAGNADDGWPVGVQIASQWGAEPLVLRIGAAIAETLR